MEQIDMRDIALFGAGGFGREIACLINLINKVEPIWNLIGFFDDGKAIGENITYGNVLGGISELNAWDSPLAIAIPVATPNTLKSIVYKIRNPCVYYPNLIAPSVIFLDKSNFKIGHGNIVCSSCLFSTNVRLGDFNIFNGSTLVGHDTKMGDYNVTMSSVNISGSISIGDCNFFGVQSVILQYLKVGDNVRVGANSVITRNTEDNNLCVGNPAVKMKF